MNNETKTQTLGNIFYGSVTFNGPMFDIHDNAHVTIQNSRVEEDADKAEAEDIPTCATEQPSSLTQLLKNAYGGSMSSARDWIAVYRVLVDSLDAPASFTGFASWINAVAPEGFPACTADALRKGDSVYLRPLYDWTPERAHGVRLSVLDRRLAIARSLKRALAE